MFREWISWLNKDEDDDNIDCYVINDDDVDLESYFFTIFTKLVVLFNNYFFTIPKYSLYNTFYLCPQHGLLYQQY